MPRPLATLDSDDSDEDDNTWDDFDQQDSAGGLTYHDHGASNGKPFSGVSQPSLALFLDHGSNSGELVTLPNAQEALQHAQALGCDFVGVVSRLGLDALAVIRLLNYLRRNPGVLSPQQVNGLTGQEHFLSDNKELEPVPGAEDDGLLRAYYNHCILPFYESYFNVY